MADKPRCFDPACGQEIHDVIVWLGTSYDEGEQEEWPFHETCANQPWPLSEVRREQVRRDDDPEGRDDRTTEPLRGV